MGRTLEEPGRVMVSWSCGKDSAYTLHLLNQDPDVEVVGLLTTVNEQFERVNIHGVRLELVEAQAEMAGLPLEVVRLPHPCPNEVYEELLADAMELLWNDGVNEVAYGDIFLEDVREYRVQFHKLLNKERGMNVDAIFPLWNHPTDSLSRRLVDTGIKATICALDLERMDASFAGRAYDHALLDELPRSIDPCGENGEFHTFVSGGPMFERDIELQVGEISTRQGNVYADLTHV